MRRRRGRKYRKWRRGEERGGSDKERRSDAEGKVREKKISGKEGQM